MVRPARPRIPGRALPDTPTTVTFARHIPGVRVVLVGLVICAAALRIVYFAQVSGTSFADMDRHAESDMHYYREWAGAIAGGDWWSARVAPPTHVWHQDVAADYFKQHPGSLKRLVDSGPTQAADPVGVLWSKWMGVPRFYQDALYPYAIAVTQRLFGADVRWVFAWQLLLGVCSTVLVWDLTRRAFGAATGLVAGVMALLTAPLLYYEMVLLRDSAVVCAALAVTWLAQWAFKRDTRIGFAGLGVVLGLAALLKSSLLLFPLAFAVALVVIHRRTPSQFAWRLGALLLGCVIGLGPLVVRNLAVGAPALALAASGPLTLVVSNEAGTEPRHGNSVDPPVLARFLGDTDGSWSAAVRVALADHTVASALHLLREKWYWSWHWYELPNNDNFYLRRQAVPVLQWLPVTAWWICPLALVGVGVSLTRKSWKQAWSLYVLLTLSLAPLLMFYVIGRFRVVLLAAAIPFAAVAMVGLVEALWQRHLRRAAAIAVAVGVVMVWTGRPLEADMRLIRSADWLLDYSVRDQPRMKAAGEQGDFEAAARACDATFDSPWTARALTAGDPDVFRQLADIRTRCGFLWGRAGNATRARQRAQAADILRGQAR